jgi:hypothetical protein
MLESFGTALAAMFLLLSGSAGGACGNNTKGTYVPPEVVFAAAGGEARVTVEIVATPEKIRRGLMHRKHMDPDRGMLFFMPVEEVQSFWMRNTHIALDMIFINSDMQVVGIVENATPRTEDSRTVGIPSIYVLEVNAGWSKQHGVTAGMTARFDNVK